jgi:hypothetical protein
MRQPRRPIAQLAIRDPFAVAPDCCGLRSAVALRLDPTVNGQPYLLPAGREWDLRAWWTGLDGGLPRGARGLPTQYALQQPSLQLGKVFWIRHTGL